MLRLPDLGPIGANGPAKARDFRTPTAWFEDRGQATELVQKFHGTLWATQLDQLPFDVAAWHRNPCHCKRDPARFKAINTDPSIYTVLTSPTEAAGVANVDFAIFPPRWMVAEHTFDPPAPRRRSRRSPGHWLEETLALIFETPQVLCPTRYALECPKRQMDYGACWNGMKRRFIGGEA